MKTGIKTIALASVVALCTSGAFAKTSRNHGHSKPEKVAVTTTVKTKTVTKVKSHPEKVSKADPGHHDEHRRRPNPNSRRRKSHHDGHVSEIHHKNHELPRPDHRPAPVVKHRHGEKRPSVVVVERHHARPVTIVEPVVEVDPAAVAAGAIVGGIIALTAIAAD